MSHHSHKIAILGAGKIGIETAKELAEAGLTDKVVLWNHSKSERNKKVEAHIDGIAQAHIARSKDGTPIHFTSDIQEALKGADIVIVTAGKPRAKDQVRSDLLAVNAAIVDPIAEGIRDYAANSNVIVVSNPVDTLTQRIQQVSGLPTEKVVGLGGVLDESRLKASIMKHLKVKAADIRGVHVLGQHGEKMVPLLKHVEINGPEGWEKLSDTIAAAVARDVQKQQTMEDAFVAETVSGGKRFIDALGTSDHFGPSGAIVHMVEAMLRGKVNGTSYPLTVSSYDATNDVYVGHLGTFGDEGNFKPGKQPEMSVTESGKVSAAIADNRAARDLLPVRSAVERATEALAGQITR